MRRGILTYHSVDGSGSVISVQPGLFRKQMETLVESGVRVVRLGEVLGGAAGVAITFDDGYQNFADEAAPVLSALRLPATVFVLSGRCGGMNGWENARGVPALPLMDWGTLRGLDAELIGLGSHGTEHEDLTRLGAARLEAEMRESRVEIEQRTGRRVAHFAYPFGRVKREVVEGARREYELAVTTSLGYVGEACDALRLPRIDTYYLRSLERFQSVTAGEGGMYVGWRHALRRLRGAD